MDGSVSEGEVSTRTDENANRPQTLQGQFKRKPGRPAGPTPVHCGPQWGGLRFRCLYCRNEYKGKDLLTLHEAHCDARFVVERGWAMAIERARRAEAHS